MFSDGFDAMLLTAEEDVGYFTGVRSEFWKKSKTHPLYLVVPREGPSPIAIVPEEAHDLLRKGSWLDSDKIQPFATPDPSATGTSLVLKTFQELDKKFGYIGVPLGSGQRLNMPVDDYLKLSFDMKGEEIKKGPELLHMRDCSKIVMEQRMVKSDLEIEKLKQAA